MWEHSVTDERLFAKSESWHSMYKSFLYLREGSSDGITDDLDCFPALSWLSGQVRINVLVKRMLKILRITPDISINKLAKELGISHITALTYLRQYWRTK